MAKVYPLKRDELQGLYNNWKNMKRIISKGGVGPQIYKYLRRERDQELTPRIRALLGIHMPKMKDPEPNTGHIKRVFEKGGSSLDELTSLIDSLFEELKDSDSAFHILVTRRMAPGTRCEEAY